MPEEMGGGHMVKLLKPVKTIPTRPPRRGRHATVWEGIVALKPGEWLPVECGDKFVLGLLQGAAYHSNRGKLQTRKRGLTLYLRRVE